MLHMPHTNIYDLHSLFSGLTARYCSDVAAIEKAWTEIEKQYTNEDRHYHTLTHLEDVVNELMPFKDNNGWDTMLFATFYHDIIYSVLKNDNEVQSAELSTKHLNILKVPENIINDCSALILATKSHAATSNEITNIFIDADMSILGREWDVYNIYAQNVRKEYGIYPDPLYNPGRKKVLTHFLNMERIFKTEYFYDKYELQARENINKEILNG